MGIEISAFFGDGEHPFRLTDAMIGELERVTGHGVGALYKRVIAQDFAANDLAEIIRLGLIGGGMAPQQARQLTDTYAVNRPFSETFPLALDVLDARWSGTPSSDQDAPA